MARTQSEHLIERQEWLEPLERGLQNAVRGAYDAMGPAGETVRDFLHGKWLGHPLHSALTDVPVGAWTAALVLDAVGDPAADTAIKVGLAGAGAAALAGLTDWHATDGSARRIGLAHGLLNIAATSLYTASAIKRARRERSTGRALSLAGFAVAMASAYLGGKLVYSKQIGVSHSVEPEQPGEFVRVMAEGDLREGELRRVEVNGKRVLLVRRSGRIAAMDEVCAHLGGPLAEGKLEGDTVECPWHGSRYRLDDGSVARGPSVHPQACFRARVREGQIEIEAGR
jgi:nitrite reductase/ring-hydroxylating ferredoxin subunit/uncharacterized membrane protein